MHHGAATNVSRRSRQSIISVFELARRLLARLPDGDFKLSISWHRRLALSRDIKSIFLMSVGGFCTEQSRVTILLLGAS